MGRKAQRRGGKGGRRKGRNKTTNEKGPKLRFKYGDRVECCMGEDPESPGIGLWKVGTVVKLWYDTEISGGTSDRPWEDGVFCHGVPGFIAAYQTLMDTGDLIFAPYDLECYIRESYAPPMPIEHHHFLRVEVKMGKTEEWRLGEVVAATKNWAEEKYSPYYIKFDDGECCNFYGPQQFIRRAKLRFRVGDRVESFDRTATVIKVWPSSDWLEKGGVVPYEVIFDDETVGDIPFDRDDWICKSDSPPFQVVFDRGDRIECREGKDADWLAGTVLQSNLDWLERDCDCAPYFVKLDDGRQKFFGGYNDRIRAIENESVMLENLSLEDDDSLFAPAPPMPDCPICFLPLPTDDEGYLNLACCGVTICEGCNYTHSKAVGFEKTCPFCRAPPPNTHELLTLMRNRIECNDADNTFCMGVYYYHGMNGLKKNRQKAFELFVKAADLGSLRACTNAALEFENGAVTEKDEAKSNYYSTKGAKLGQVKARHKLGSNAAKKGEWDVALRHWKISASAGFKGSLNQILDSYNQGMLSKEECENVLSAHQQTRAEASSAQRKMAKENQIVCGQRFSEDE